MSSFFPPGVRASESAGRGTEELGGECQEGGGAARTDTSRKGTSNEGFSK